MKKKIAGTLVLVLLTAAAVFMAVRSYEQVRGKLSQDEYEIIETVEETQKAGTEESKAVVQKAVPEESAAETQEPETEHESESQTQTETQTETNPAAPVLTMIGARIEIIKGSVFDITAAVKEITDDKDDRSRLFRDIRVIGDYDTAQEGEYPLKYIVTDSDSNESIPQTITLVVKAG